MNWDDPLQKSYEDQTIVLVKTIHGILLNYYRNDSKECSSKVVKELVQDVERLSNQLVGISDPELDMSEHEIEEILNNLMGSVINEPFTMDSFIKIHDEMDRVYAKRFFHDTARERAETKWEHMNVGNAKAELGRIVEALRHYDKAISIDQGFLPGYLGRVYCLIALDEVEEAIKSIEFVCDYEGYDLDDYYEFVALAEEACRFKQNTLATKLIKKALEIIIYNLHIANVENDHIVIQIDNIKHYIYFETLEKIIKLIKIIACRDEDMKLGFLKKAENYIHEIRSSLGI